jgi:hypothetical protein
LGGLSTLSRPVTRNAAQWLRNLSPTAAQDARSSGVGHMTGENTFGSPPVVSQLPFTGSHVPTYPAAYTVQGGQIDRNAVQSRGPSSPTVASPATSTAFYPTLENQERGPGSGCGVPGAVVSILPPVLSGAPKRGVDGGTQSCAGSTEAAGGTPIHAFTSESRFLTGSARASARSPSPQSRTGLIPPAPLAIGHLSLALGCRESSLSGAAVGAGGGGGGGGDGGGAAHSSMSVAAAESTISYQAVEGTVTSVAENAIAVNDRSTDIVDKSTNDANSDANESGDM